MTATLRRLSAALSLAAVAALPVRAQQADPIRYTVRIPAPATHYLEGELPYRGQAGDRAHDGGLDPGLLSGA
jgi:hypothetical protein